MSIGKSSITKRVAKQAEPEKSTEKNIAPELVATVAVAPKADTKKAPAKKATTASTTKKTSSSTAKKAPAKKATATEKLTPPAEESKKVDTAVIANISPKTVAAVIGHEEKSGFEKVQLGEKMPVHLL